MDVNVDMDTHTAVCVSHVCVSTHSCVYFVCEPVCFSCVGVHTQLCAHDSMHIHHVRRPAGR
jgi:hypothetical protein